MQTHTSRMQPVLYIGLAVFIAVAIFNQSSIPTVNHIDTADAFNMINTGRVLVIDVREQSAYEKDHLPNAIAVPIGELDERMDEFEAHKAEEMIIYCNEGSHRGPTATARLNEAGFAGAKNLKGGIEGWRAANYSTIK